MLDSTADALNTMAAAVVFLPLMIVLCLLVCWLPYKLFPPKDKSS